MSQAILLTPSAALAEATRQAALNQLNTLGRRAILAESLQRSRIVIVKDIWQAIHLSNEYAPEHLLIEVENARSVLPQITAAGSVFLGHYSPEPMGDYCSGTNHVLPTYGYARAYSGLSLLDFFKRITVQELSTDGLRALGPTAQTLAELEGLDAHALAVSLRLRHLESCLE
jgi:histidinol dehydrogenase